MIIQQHLERELRAAGLQSGNNPEEDKLVADLRELVALISNQGHSGSSRTQTLQLLDRIVHLKPLTPLTGRDAEWEPVEHAPGMFQNVRCSTVFKDEDEVCRDIGMKPVYVRPDGMSFTRSEDEAPIITFPYMPGFPPVIPVALDGKPL